MSNIEKIRQEIERRIGSVNEKQDANPAMPKYRWYMYEGMKEAFIDMKYFIDSLPEEKPSEDLEEAVENYIAPIENDEGLDYINFNGKDIKDAFIAGAEWQKEQMMKDAVEGDYDCQYMTPAVFLDKYLDGIKDGDKVRIIIVKED